MICVPRRAMIFVDKLHDYFASMKISIEFSPTLNDYDKLTIKNDLNLAGDERIDLEGIKGIQNVLYDHFNKKTIIQTTNKEKFSIIRHDFLRYIGDCKYKHYCLYLDTHLPIYKIDTGMNRVSTRYFHICVPVTDINISFMDPHYVIQIASVR